MECKGAQDQAQNYRCKNVYDGVFHGVAFHNLTVMYTIVMATIASMAGIKIMLTTPSFWACTVLPCHELSGYAQKIP